MHLHGEIEALSAQVGHEALGGRCVRGLARGGGPHSLDHRQHGDVGDRSGAVLQEGRVVRRAEQRDAGIRVAGGQGVDGGEGEQEVADVPAAEDRDALDALDAVADRAERGAGLERAAGVRDVGHRPSFPPFLSQIVPAVPPPEGRVTSSASWGTVEVSAKSAEGAARGRDPVR
ncbi:hypothetical protein [Naasia aerilata]|uniref:Uncharacterized protein n=1 Tax=Naasia aerilata TaxID=1162966 RepID=A0ABN6XKX2_9MICO|nr:hypothetical protein GCM10025866_02190 [Naasia aerilata]